MQPIPEVHFKSVERLRTNKTQGCNYSKIPFQLHQGTVSIWWQTFMLMASFMLISVKQEVMQYLDQCEIHSVRKSHLASKVLDILYVFITMLVNLVNYIIIAGR